MALDHMTPGEDVLHIAAEVVVRHIAGAGAARTVAAVEEDNALAVVEGTDLEAEGSVLEEEAAVDSSHLVEVEDNGLAEEEDTVRAAADIVPEEGIVLEADRNPEAAAVLELVREEHWCDSRGTYGRIRLHILGTTYCYVMSPSAR